MKTKEKVIRFGDFLSGKSNYNNKRVLKESFSEVELDQTIEDESDEGDIIDFDKNPYAKTQFDIKEIENDYEQEVDQEEYDDSTIDKVYSGYPEQTQKNQILTKENKIQSTKNYYTLYKDISEKFSCDIMVEGAKTDDTITRLIIETEDWTLMFPGQIKNGKVVIPIKRLSLFDEGQTGKIKLEVIAEGTVFIPWEDTFKIKMSKKVSVKMNENRRPIESAKPKTNITVNVKRR